jgi:UDPglucose--hexose-1-phosphate uridylyltransferase
VIRRYDLLYGCAFPYVMSILQAPVDDGDYSGYHLHLLLQPPLRQPGLQKFLAGPEIGGGNFMSDTIPEEKARELQNINFSAYKENE